MTLVKTSIEIIDQLRGLLVQINAEDYSKELSVLSKNTIGKHVRHVLEFYECLQNGIVLKEINYDARQRNLKLESNPTYALEICDGLKALLEQNEADRPMRLLMDYGKSELASVDTTYYRELAYNIEHAVHHFAIIGIAVKNELQHIGLASNFGIAYSTVKYQESQQCAQ
jgi:hypothetical protein